MSVEEQISASLESRLGTHLKRSHQALMVAKERVLKPYGLSVPQYAALYALSIASLSGAQLARVACVTPQSMASLLSTLEAKGLIERTPSDVHAQVLVARLTPHGRTTFRKANTATLAVENGLSAAFTDEEEKQLRELLGRAVSRLTAE